MPNAFTFINQTGVSTNSVRTSNTVTPTGYEGPLSVSISGEGTPQLQINSGAWSTSGSMNPGDTLTIRLTSSSSYVSTRVATLSLGDYDISWSVRTEALADSIPDSFSFTDNLSAELSTLTYSNTITTSGYNQNLAVSVSGSGSPELSVNGGAWTTSSTMNSGDTIRIRLTSGASYGVTNSAILSLGSYDTTWNVKTINPFVSTWNTSATSFGSSTTTQIKLPLESTGAYNFVVYWGDGTNNTITTWNQAETTHTYATAGVYNVGIRGTIKGFRFNGDGDRNKILDIKNWGELNLGNNGYYFYYCSNLNITAVDAPDLSGTTNFDYMFAGASKFNGKIDHWNTENITTMAHMFHDSFAFNQPLSNWNTGKVTDMTEMFSYANKFNQNIDSWDTGRVTYMDNMFFDAQDFNQSLDSWDVRNVTSMGGMFYYASSFNQPLNNWDVKNLTSMADLFSYASSFNQPLNNWNTSSVTDMGWMFDGATSFNQDLRSWCVPLIASEPTSFAAGSPLNTSGMKPVWGTCPFVPMATDFISTWDTTKTGTGSSTVTQIKLPLESTGTYNFVVYWGDGSNNTITAWNQAETTYTYATAGVYDVSIRGTIKGFGFDYGGDKLKILDVKQWGSLNVGNSGSYFYGCENFNSSATDALNLTGTTNLYYMFSGAYKFNGKIGNWNLSGVDTIRGMFYNAFNFNQPINDWDVSSVTNMGDLFSYASSFNQPLNNWDTRNVVKMSYLFTSTDSFNQPLDNWNTSKVNDMSRMFRDAISFNQSLENWDVSNVENMYSMFAGASNFNHPLNNWNTKNVTNTNSIFYYASSFNQPLNNWNTSKVTDMGWMFDGATVFNQDLRSWCVPLIATEPTDFALDSPLNTNGMKPIWGTCPAPLKTESQCRFKDNKTGCEHFYEEKQIDTYDVVHDTLLGLYWIKSPDSTIRTWVNAQSYCSGLGSGWRLPTLVEMEASLVDTSKSSERYIVGGNGNLFTNIQSNMYWTNTQSSGSYSYIVVFNGGYSGSGLVSSSYYALCVKSES